MMSSEGFTKEAKSSDELQRCIEGQPTETEIGDRKAEICETDLEENMGKKIEWIGLIFQALWELVRDNNNLSDHALFDKVREVELREGSPDCKVNPTPKQCPRCSRTISRRTMRCYYCGTQLHKWVSLIE